MPAHTLQGYWQAEPLKGKLKGYWSRRMTQEHRLLYKVDEHSVFIVSCRYHYEK
ncbi:MAG: Txe/YoeB family addiction module toxin [Hymenobacter sp.]